MAQSGAQRRAAQRALSRDLKSGGRILPESTVRRAVLVNNIGALKRELYGDKFVGTNIPQGASIKHLETAREILQKKADYSGTWGQFWDENPEYDRDEYADVEYYK